MAERDFFSDLDTPSSVSPPGAAQGPARDPYAGLPPEGFSPPKSDPQTVYRGSILPISRDSSGNVHFDPFGAGPLGQAYEAAKLPGEIMSGDVKVDPANPTFMGRVAGFTGAFGPGVNPMMRSGDRAIPGIRMAPKDPALATVPASGKLLERGGEQLDAFRDLPIKYDPTAFGTLATQTEQELLKKGVFRVNSPQLYGYLDELRKGTPSGSQAGTISASPANLMAMRENLAGLFGKDAEHQAGVGVAFDKLNNFIEKPPQGAVLAGSPAFLSAYGPELYSRGRSNYAAGMRAADLEDIKKTADFRAASANSGLNPDNSLRSRVTSAILDAKRMRGFTDPEIAALEAVPLGTTKRNLLRYAGNALGGGGGPVAALPAGIVGSAADYLGLPHSVAMGIGAATPALGAALKRAAGKSTAEALDEAINMTKRRSPLFQDMGRQDLVPDAVRGRDAVARALARMYAQPTAGQIFQPPTEVPMQKPVLEYDPNRT